jgi:hypothetical protein
MLIQNVAAPLLIPEEKNEETDDDEGADDTAGDRKPRQKRLHYQRGLRGRRAATR